MKARVKDGRLVLDEPTDLPDGTEVQLVHADAGDDLDDEDRKKLHAALARSEEDVAYGRVRPANEILTELRAAEIERRARRALAGESQGTDWETVRDRIESKLADE